MNLGTPKIRTESVISILTLAWVPFDFVLVSAPHRIKICDLFFKYFVTRGGQNKSGSPDRISAPPPCSVLRIPYTTLHSPRRKIVWTRLCISVDGSVQGGYYTWREGGIVHIHLLGASEITANLYCYCVHLH